ncbi:MAG: membrane lipoprotein lipid attachment site-containing protein, partial [Hellea sp.]|nr:membrane lipoprotein lipid attachment site-containing protein [Hellea sp.]
MKKLFFTTLLALIVTGCEKESNADSGGVTLGTFTGDLNINSQSSLDSAITEGTYINAIGGNLVVSTGGSTGLTVGDVEYITSQINSVGGDVTINTPDGSLNLSELSSVGGNYSIQGSDA